MKKRFGNLSKGEQEKIEMEYHQMDPEEFDNLMSAAKTYTTASIRLPGELVGKLKVVAKLEGEWGYQSMVRKWITERLQQETRMALRLSEMPLKEVVAVLEKQIIK
ncbi:MAG: hypothetical protein AB1414_12335 [bacterium]